MASSCLLVLLLLYWKMICTVLECVNPAHTPLEKTWGSPGTYIKKFPWGSIFFKGTARGSSQALKLYFTYSTLSCYPFRFEIKIRYMCLLE